MVTKKLLGLILSGSLFLASTAKAQEAALSEKKVEEVGSELAKEESPKVTEAPTEPSKMEPPKAETQNVEFQKTDVPKTETLPNTAAPPPSDAKPDAKAQPKTFNKRWSLSVETFGGGYDSKGDATLSITNPSQFPTLTSGEKIPVNVEKGSGSGIQIGGGYRFNDWLSMNGLIMLMGSKSESSFTTANGNKHRFTTETGLFYVSPFTWTAYPVSWLYVSAGLGFAIESHKIKSDITNMGELELGAAGGASTLGVGVEFALGKSWTLRGGLNFLGANMRSLNQKINEGTLNEVNVKLEDRKVEIGVITIGTKFYF